MGYYRELGVIRGEPGVRRAELGVIRAEPGVLRAEADDFRLGRGVHVAGHSNSFFQDSVYHNRRRGLHHRDRRFLHRRTVVPGPGAASCVRA